MMLVTSRRCWRWAFLVVVSTSMRVADSFHLVAPSRTTLVVVQPRRRSSAIQQLLLLPERGGRSIVLVPPPPPPSTVLASSFYGKFDEPEEDDEDDDDDDDYDDLDDKAVADFRTRMTSLFDAAGGSGNDENDDDTIIADELLQLSVADKPLEWARPLKADNVIRAGCILAANPRAFCSDFGSSDGSSSSSNGNPSPQLLSKFGLTLPPPADLGADRRADLLPVLVVTEYNPETKAARAVLLNRRTGYLLGDLEQPPPQSQQQSGAPSSSSPMPAPLLEKFCIQPLWFGGVDSNTQSSSSNSNNSNNGNGGGGLDMLHQCPTVTGAVPITDDGLYWGGDPAQAQDALDEAVAADGRRLTGFDFKFFVQSTHFPPGELQRELEKGTFFACAVGKEILFKSRDRMGTRRAKPLWTEIMELLGGDYRRVRDRLYGLDDNAGDEEQDGTGSGTLQ